MDSAGSDNKFDCILQIPPLSPSRRDYGIRSPTARSPGRVNFDSFPSSSRPQSPWRPRDSPNTSREVETFRLYESNPPPLVLDRSSYYSGPLPEAGKDRSSAFPSFSGPLPGFASPTTESFEFATWARIYHRQHAQDRNSSLPGSPEVGSSRESSFREEPAAASSSAGEDDTEKATSTFYLASPSPEFSARAGMHGRVGSVSGELGRTDEVAKQKALVARGYKSGEISGLELLGGGYNNNVVVDDARQQRWESLNDPKKKDIAASPSNCDSEPMVTIPFKWEDAASGKAKSTKSRSSRTSSKGAQIGAGIGDFSFGSSHTKTASETAESVDGSEASVSVASAIPAKKKVVATTKKAVVVHSAVPFKWEDAPGKPKLEDTIERDAERTTLQLPPRLASASVKRTSWTTSTPSTSSSRSNSSLSRARTSKAQFHNSSDSTSSQQQPKTPKAKSLRQSSRQPSPLPSPRPSAPPSPRPSAPPSPRPSASPHPFPFPLPHPIPLPQDVVAAAPEPPRHTLGPNFLSGPLDSTAKPKGSSTISKSGPISQYGFPQNADFFSVRSPTSTLQGPGSSSSQYSSHPSSENCSRKSASVAYSHSQSGTSAESLEHWSDGHHEFESEISTIARPRLPWKTSSSSSSSKPPMSPINSSSGRSKFGSTDMASEDPPSRLPYKMPEQEIVVKPEVSSAPSRSGSRCFQLPRFRSKSNVVELSGWDDDAPSSCLEDGYRSPAYRATLELLSPSTATTATAKSRSVKLGSASPRQFVEGLRNSVKHSLQIFSRRNSRKSNPTVNHDDSFMKRHPSLTL